MTFSPFQTISSTTNFILSDATLLKDSDIDLALQSLQLIHPQCQIQSCPRKMDLKNVACTFIILWSRKFTWCLQLITGTSWPRSTLAINVTSKYWKKIPICLQTTSSSTSLKDMFAQTISATAKILQTIYPDESRVRVNFFNVIPTKHPRLWPSTITYAKYLLAGDPALQVFDHAKNENRVQRFRDNLCRYYVMRKFTSIEVHGWLNFQLRNLSIPALNSKKPNLYIFVVKS
jgi:hypothetical protein